MFEEIYTITALQKKPHEVKDAARKGIVRITENGNAAFVFCSEDVLKNTIQEAIADALYEAEFHRAIKAAEADKIHGRYYNNVDEAFEAANKLREENKNAGFIDKKSGEQ